MRTTYRLPIWLLLPLLPACGLGSSESLSGMGDIEMHSRSTRADAVSGGDALVEIVFPRGVAVDELRVISAGGVDYSRDFARRADGRVLGLVTNLPLGRTELRAELPGAATSILQLDNHSIGGPIFSGPQVQPWVCDTQSFGLGQAADEQCNAPTVFSYQYRSAVTGLFQAYDPDSPPSDVAATTTDAGKTVPYIVRVERLTMNRGIVDIAVLAAPDQDWDRWAEHPGWNGKLMFYFGGGTDARYTTSGPPPVLDDNALSRGLMVATSGLLIHGRNANHVVAAELVMMVKEHVRERYGDIVYTIGQGCSGGGIFQHMIASGYPGLLDGIIPACSYPDIWTTAMEVGDCLLLNNYFYGHGFPAAIPPTLNSMWPEPVQQSQVMGHSSPSVCIAWENLFGSRMYPDRACGAGPGAEYDAQNNPEGVRCSLSDFQMNIWGERPPEVWGEVERQIGHGFAGRSLGNAGVQYGLAALLQGVILPEQFVDLNEKIGGFDIDGNFMVERMRPDPGTVAIAYRSGQVSDARQLAKVPIIDLRGQDDYEIHTSDWSYVIRERLDRHNGHHDNQIIFTGAIPAFGDPAFSCASGMSSALFTDGTLQPTPKEVCTANPLELMDRWLQAITADTSAEPLENKVVSNKPADAVDTCFFAGVPVTDPTVCSAAYPYFSNPRVVAGAPQSHDILQCQLKPLVREDYQLAGSRPVNFSDAQWSRLEAVFPNGVCDWSLPDIDDQPSIPWMNFGAGPGGRSMGMAPEHQQ